MWCGIQYYQCMSVCIFAEYWRENLILIPLIAYSQPLSLLLYVFNTDCFLSSGEDTASLIPSRIFMPLGVRPWTFTSGFLSQLCSSVYLWIADSLVTICIIPEFKMSCYATDSDKWITVSVLYCIVSIHVSTACIHFCFLKLILCYIEVFDPSGYTCTLL